MIPIIKKLFFSRARSSSNLFLALPVLILVSVGCLCSGKDEPRTCVTSDGANLIWAGSGLLNIRLADGSITTAEKVRYAEVLCSPNGEVIKIGENSTYKNNAPRSQKTAWLQNAGRSYELADIESFQNYLGFIQNRYFVSASRGFVERTRSSGKSRVTYNVYNQPQVFNLEDSRDGQLKSHYLHRDKLGLPETTLYEDVWFYPLSLDENGSLLFGMKVKGENSVGFYKMNMFDGAIARTGVSFSMPAEMYSLKNVAADKSGKFVAFVYDEQVGGEYRTVINVFNFETRRIAATKNIGGISFMNDSPRLIFEENGAKLAVMIEGVKLKESGGVREIAVFDLQTGGEISNIDAIEYFDKPDSVRALRLIGDDLLVNYVTAKKPFRDRENRLCKINVTNKQIVWDKVLPGK